MACLLLYLFFFYNISSLLSIFYLVFNLAVSKQVKPSLDNSRNEIAKINLSKKEKTAKLKKIQDKLEKEAVHHFQKGFQGPLGEELCVFIPEPQKGRIQTPHLC